LKKETVFIWTDPGADIDDEVALFWLFNEETYCDKYIYEVAIGGAGKLDAWKEFQKKFPTKCGSNNAVTYHEKDSLDKISRKITPDYMIVLAPGIDKILNSLDFTNLKLVGYQGSLPQMHPKLLHPDYTLINDENGAFNDRDSRNFFIRLNNEEKEGTVICVTTEECKKQENLFGKELFKNNQYWSSHTNRELDKNIQEIVFETVFKNMVGRMHPKHTYNKFAETLINPEIKGANYNLVKDIYDKINNNGTHTAMSDTLRKAIDDYIKDLNDNTEGPLKENTHLYLMEMSIYIGEIIGKDPVDDNGKLLTSSDENNNVINLHKKYNDAYNNFKNVGILSPAFDLVTMKKTMDIINSSQQEVSSNLLSRSDSRSRSRSRFGGKNFKKQKKSQRRKKSKIKKKVSAMKKVSARKSLKY
tara:strand:+ start:459 stop:1706 length:1248 start_codon:yes stop_codon:yes gene_type:complete